MKRLLTAVTVSAALAALTFGVTTAAASSTTSPSYICTNDTYFSFDTGTIVFNPNGGVSHGGCVSTQAKYGYADLENEVVLSNAALVSNCKLIGQSFQDMASQIPLDVAGQLIGRTFTSSSQLGSYVFHDIFGPNPATCTAILAADHASIPYGGYDVYYTGGSGPNTTYQIGVPPDLAALFGA